MIRRWVTRPLHEDSVEKVAEGNQQVEESAAAADSLSQQAAQLVRAVGVFRLEATTDAP